MYLSERDWDKNIEHQSAKHLFSDWYTLYKRLEWNISIFLVEQGVGQQLYVLMREYMESVTIKGNSKRLDASSLTK